MGRQVVSLGNTTLLESKFESWSIPGNSKLQLSTDFMVCVSVAVSYIVSTFPTTL